MAQGSLRIGPVPPPGDEEESDPHIISAAHRRRSPWRRRLVDAERGLTEGVRGDSLFFVHLFCTTIVLMASAVFGLPLVHWLLLMLSIGAVFAAELFLKALFVGLESLTDRSAETARNLRRVRRIGTAGVFVVIISAGLCILLILGNRLASAF